jgi:CHAT domain-containing protein
MTVNLQYVQSASVFALLAERRDQYRADPRRPSVFAVGGALYSGGPAAQRGLSLRGVVGSGMEGEVTRGKRERLALIWPELPNSEVEARSVAQLFPGSKLLVGSQASEAELLRTDREGELANYKYLLFATHGYLDLDSPQLSAVVLSQVGTGDADGYVTAAEWLGYRLRSDLTVLSACETGVGRQVRGEGVWGLPYALFVAGNTNTVVTLWPVADQSTSLFVQRFFARLRDGQGHAVALAETKREFLRDRRLRAPIHWAGFVLYGV